MNINVSDHMHISCRRWLQNREHSEGTARTSNSLFPCASFSTVCISTSPPLVCRNGGVVSEKFTQLPSGDAEDTLAEFWQGSGILPRPTCCFLSGAAGVTDEWWWVIFQSPLYDLHT